ncbi:DUF72 domain-containing protein [Mucilaginibacter gynuensis]|uniref:DUF72 domain-containing protein n=1 Tax=Mucilaginibacter gynuensis TaxID=1302236 RepID=A0ABP8GLP0_9SPHI
MQLMIESLKNFELVPFTADTDSTKNTLQQNSTEDPLRIFIGAPKWSEKNWKGIIYPVKAPADQFLSLYSRQFNTVEFGATFYNAYDAEAISRWTAQVAASPDFRFCPKFPQSISHICRLLNAEEHTARFYQSLSDFGEQLGPLLLQLSDNFSPKSLPNLRNFLEELDLTVKVSVEIRHKDWFADTAARKELFDLLRGLHVGTVISDTTGRRDCVHMELTTGDAFIRFVGNNLDPTDYQRLDNWVERIAQWGDQGLQSLWFFLHQNNERFVPQACVYFIEKLNTRLGIAVKAPELISGK